MKTDELIDMLGTNVSPVRYGQLRNTLIIALTVGAVTAFCLMLATLGMPADQGNGEYFGFKLLALAFTLGIVAAGSNFLFRAARPAESGRRPLLFIRLLFFAIVVAGIIALVLVHPAAWTGMLFGAQWTACLICIPLFSVVPFAALIWALRNGAPTNLVRAGSITGLVAGALGAAAVAFHHSGESLPFIALWYGGPIAICALVGALLGPRLLRW